MLSRVCAIALLFVVPTLFGAEQGSPCEEFRAKPLVVLKPVKISVIDRKSHAPIEEFAYSASYATCDGTGQFTKGWQSVKSPSGMFVLDAPLACRLFIRIRWRHALTISTRVHEFVVRSADPRRHEVIELERGETVVGIVRDASTRKPVAGATVTHSGANTVEDHVVSDSQGRYALHGLYPEGSVSAFHPDYGGREFAVEVAIKSRKTIDLDLQPVDRVILRGVVRDEDGRPLEGVSVSVDGTRTVRPVTSGLGHRLEIVFDGETRAQTGRDGTYALSCMTGRPNQRIVPRPRYDKNGYVSREVAGNLQNGNEQSVVLQRQVLLEGQVLAPMGNRWETSRCVPSSPRENQ